MQFEDSSFDLVLSKDTLEHFIQPWTVVKEVHRILKLRGLFVIWVPFIHPFHGSDFYRYSPLGLRHLLADFEILRFESPTSVFPVFGLLDIDVLKRSHMGLSERPIKTMCRWLDRRLTKRRNARNDPMSFAHVYRWIARKVKSGTDCKHKGEVTILC